MLKHANNLELLVIYDLHSDAQFHESLNHYGKIEDAEIKRLVE